MRRLSFLTGKNPTPAMLNWLTCLLVYLLRFVSFPIKSIVKHYISSLAGSHFLYYVVYHCYSLRFLLSYNPYVFFFLKILPGFFLSSVVYVFNQGVAVLLN